MRISLSSGRAAGDGEHSDEVQARADAGLDVDLRQPPAQFVRGLPAGTVSRNNDGWSDGG